MSLLLGPGSIIVAKTDGRLLLSLVLEFWWIFSLNEFNNFSKYTCPSSDYCQIHRKIGVFNGLCFESDNGLSLKLTNE